MNIFLAKYINRVDAKGRVSVPASYRTILMKENLNGIVIYPSFKNNCIEACSMSHLEQITQAIQKLDPYSEERDAFETVVLGEAIYLQFDNEGRVILTSCLMQQVEIEHQACFVGKGSVFEIWNPENFAKHLVRSREIAQSSKSILKNHITV